MSRPNSNPQLSDSSFVRLLRALHGMAPREGMTAREMLGAVSPGAIREAALGFADAPAASAAPAVSTSESGGEIAPPETELEAELVLARKLRFFRGSTVGGLVLIHRSGRSAEASRWGAESVGLDADSPEAHAARKAARVLAAAGNRATVRREDDDARDLYEAAKSVLTRPTSALSKAGATYFWKLAHRLATHHLEEAAREESIHTVEALRIAAIHAIDRAAMRPGFDASAPEHRREVESAVARALERLEGREGE